MHKTITIWGVKFQVFEPRVVYNFVLFWSVLNEKIIIFIAYLFLGSHNTCRYYIPCSHFHNDKW